MIRKKIIFSVFLVLISLTATGIVNVTASFDYFVGYDIYVHDNHAYVTTNDGVFVLKLTDLANPVKIGEITIGGAFGIAGIDDLIIIASPGNGIITANITTPDNPVNLNEFPRDAMPNGLSINGSHIFVAYHTGDLEIIDISDPTTPFLTASLEDYGRGLSTGVKQNVVYLADPDNGLKVINVTDLSSPHKTSTVPGTSGAWDIHIQDDLLYLGCHGLGVKIIDISDPFSPSIIGRYSKIGGEAYGITGNSTHVYVADLQKGSYLLDITNPALPAEIASYSNAAPHDIFFDDENIYLADQDKGLIILDQDLKEITQVDITSINSSISSSGSSTAISPGFELSFGITALVSILVIRCRKGGNKFDKIIRNRR